MAAAPLLNAVVKSVLSADTVRGSAAARLGSFLRLPPLTGRSLTLSPAQLVLRGNVVGGQIPKERVLHLEALTAPKVGNQKRPDEVTNYTHPTPHPPQDLSWTARALLWFG